MVSSDEPTTTITLQKSRQTNIIESIHIKILWSTNPSINCRLWVDAKLGHFRTSQKIFWLTKPARFHLVHVFTTMSMIKKHRLVRIVMAYFFWLTSTFIKTNNNWLDAKAICDILIIYKITRRIFTTSVSATFSQKMLISVSRNNVCYTLYLLM